MNVTCTFICTSEFWAHDFQFFRKKTQNQILDGVEYPPIKVLASNKRVVFTAVASKRIKQERTSEQLMDPIQTLKTMIGTVLHVLDRQRYQCRVRVPVLAQERSGKNLSRPLASTSIVEQKRLLVVDYVVIYYQYTRVRSRVDGWEGAHHSSKNGINTIPGATARHDTTRLAAALLCLCLACPRTDIFSSQESRKLVPPTSSIVLLHHESYSSSSGEPGDHRLRSLAARQPFVVCHSLNPPIIARDTRRRSSSAAAYTIDK